MQNDLKKINGVFYLFFHISLNELSSKDEKSHLSKRLCWIQLYI